LLLLPVLLSCACFLACNCLQLMCSPLLACAFQQLIHQPVVEPKPAQALEDAVTVSV
jgi:hypothetical protein